jgi:hypothetical protein
VNFEGLEGHLLICLATYQGAAECYISRIFFIFFEIEPPFGNFYFSMLFSGKFQYEHMYMNCNILEGQGTGLFRSSIAKATRAMRLQHLGK